jgi:iron complex outermembrane receptor protein
MNMHKRTLQAASASAILLFWQSAALAGQAGANPAMPPVEQVIITASPLTTDPNQLAAPVVSVDRDQILKAGGANLADALADLPGLSATTFASGASRPVIRGFDASRVRILENGVGVFDVSDIGPDHAVPTGPLGTERIEVVRGPATVRYGSQAIGGVVNALNNRIPVVLPMADFSGQASGSYGTVNRAGDGAALIDARAGQFAFHIDGYARGTSDYDTPEGKQLNSYFRGDGASIGGSYFFGTDNRIGAALIHYDSTYGIPSDTTHIKMKQTKEQFGSFFDLDSGPFKTLTVTGGYGDYSHDEIDPSGVVLDTFKDKEWDSRAETVLGPLGPFSSSAVGIQLGRRDFSALGDALNFLFPSVTATEAVFAFTEMPFTDTLKLQLGGRVEWADLKGTPASLVPTKVNFTPASGSAGVVFDPTDTLTFAITASSSARAPNVVELFAHGPHDGPGTFETGNPNLAIERANSLEGLVRLHMTDVQFEGSLWGVTFNRYIFGHLTGNTCDEDGNCSFPGPGDFKELNYDQGGARFWGVEGKVTAKLLTLGPGDLVGDALADYVRATLKTGGNVPLIPPYHLGVGLSWLSEDFDADLHMYHTGAQDQVGNGLAPTKAYISVDADLTWRANGILPGFAISLIGRNLTDSIQRNAVALNHDVVELPGRDVRVVARYTF